MTIWVTWNVFSEQCVGEGRSRCIHINVRVGHREDSGFRRPTRVSLILNFNLDIYMLCLVSARNVLDKENKGVYVLMSGLDIERVFVSSGCVGWELIYDQFTVIVNWRYYRYLHFNYARIQWMLMRRFCGFDQNHLILLEDINKSLQFMIMFSMVFLYMCMYLYIWKKPQHQHL